MPENQPKHKQFIVIQIFRYSEQLSHRVRSVRQFSTRAVNIESECNQASVMQMYSLMKSNYLFIHRNQMDNCAK